MFNNILSGCIAAGTLAANTAILAKKEQDPRNLIIVTTITILATTTILYLTNWISKKTAQIAASITILAGAIAYKHETIAKYKALKTANDFCSSKIRALLIKAGIINEEENRVYSPMERNKAKEHYTEQERECFELRKPEKTYNTLEEFENAFKEGTLPRKHQGILERCAADPWFKDLLKARFAEHRWDVDFFASLPTNRDFHTIEQFKEAYTKGILHPILVEIIRMGEESIAITGEKIDWLITPINAAFYIYCMACKANPEDPYTALENPDLD